MKRHTMDSRLVQMALRLFWALFLTTAFGATAFTASVIEAFASQPTKLEVTADADTVQVGETLQLKVRAWFDDGSVRDVTAAPETQYFPTTVDKSVLVASKGLLKAVGLPDQGLSPYIEGSSSVGIMVVYKTVADAINLTIREKAGKFLHVSAPTTTLRVGETTQLTVIRHEPDDSTQDVTDPATGTTYFTNNQFVLIAEPSGKAICIGTRGKPKEIGIIAVRNHDLNGWLRFELLPDGPGPSLEVTADHTTLREGARVHLHVYRSIAGNGREEVTQTSQYFTFPGYGSEGAHDPSVISIDEAGVATATNSLGRWINEKTVVVFVRNGQSAGWTELTVVH